MPELSSQRQERFCQYAATGMTADQAYIAAGYRPNRGNPSRLKAKDSIRQRITEIEREISSKLQQAVVQQATITKQYLIDALIENIEKSLGRQPVKDGIEGHTVDRYTFRPEAANNAIKMGGQECGMFRDRVEVTYKMDFSDLSDYELLLQLQQETAELIEMRAKRRALENGEDELAPKIASGSGQSILPGSQGPVRMSRR